MLAGRRNRTFAVMAARVWACHTRARCDLLLHTTPACMSSCRPTQHCPGEVHAVRGGCASAVLHDRPGHPPGRQGGNGVPGRHDGHHRHHPAAGRWVMRACVCAGVCPCALIHTACSWGVLRAMTDIADAILQLAGGCARRTLSFSKHYVGIPAWEVVLGAGRSRSNACVLAPAWLCNAGHLSHRPMSIMLLPTRKDQPTTDAIGSSPGLLPQMPPQTHVNLPVSTHKPAPATHKPAPCGPDPLSIWPTNCQPAPTTATANRRRQRDRRAHRRRRAAAERHPRRLHRPQPGMVHAPAARQPPVRSGTASLPAHAPHAALPHRAPGKMLQVTRVKT